MLAQQMQFMIPSTTMQPVVSMSVWLKNCQNSQWSTLFCYTVNVWFCSWLYTLSSTTFLCFTLCFYFLDGHLSIGNCSVSSDKCHLGQCFDFQSLNHSQMQYKISVKRRGERKNNQNRDSIAVLACSYLDLLRYPWANDNNLQLLSGSCSTICGRWLLLHWSGVRCAHCRSYSFWGI